MVFNRDMSNTDALTEATNNIAAAKAAIETARSNAARRDANEELTFWIGRRAMLTTTKGW
jgi:1,2-phenylacetyl-CoA epoxidase PaaB subunit